MTRILAVKNWEQFQHYKDRDPPWIKLYRDTLTTEAWVLGTDVSRLVQVASTLLAARYRNEIPLNFGLLKRVASLDCSEKAFDAAIAHLVEHNFLEIHEVTDARKQPASTMLATCATTSEVLYSEGEQSRAEERESRAEPMSAAPTGVSPTESVFEHWRRTHDHPQAHLDTKRRKLIAAALQQFSEADLCQAISGYKHSPHHMGQNERGTVYDDIELFLRDSKHIEAGLKFYHDPPRTDLSAKTRANIAAIADWVPPEVRHATA